MSEENNKGPGAEEVKSEPEQVSAIQNSSSTGTTNEASETLTTDNSAMEVHHHTHAGHGKKTWKDYSWEFVVWKKNKRFTNMKQNLVLLFCLLIVIMNSSCRNSAPKLSIDAVKASPGNFRILSENEHVRVVEYSLQPGEKDNWHTHPPKSSYVVSGGQLKVYLENGDSILADEKVGTASWMDYAGKHYVENTGSTTVTIILTEIK